MKIAILTEGGKTGGFGHITRCMAIYQAFISIGASCEMVVNGDKTAADLLKGFNFKIMNWLKHGQFPGFISDSEIVVIDSYLADIGLYTKVSSIANKAVYLDDFNRINYSKGIVLNGNIFAEELTYPLDNGNIYLLGPKYIPLREEFVKIPRKTINRYIKKVMVNFGGRGNLAFAKRMISCLKKEFKFSFKLIKGNHNAQQMLKAMMECDVCICGGGQMLNELARCGVPTIGICFADNQKDNLRVWQKKGFIQYAGWHNDKHLIYNLGKTLQSILDYDKRREISKIGQRFVDGLGPERITGRILNNG